MAGAAQRRKRFFVRAARPASLRDAEQADPDYGRSDEPDWRGIDWSAHTRQLTVAGTEVNFVCLGEVTDAPPVVFVHGLAGNWQNWLENLPAIAEQRPVVALDLPGFGESPMPAQDISIAGYAECVEELCARLELGRVILVGNSMGGFISAEVAMRHPQRVERLVLVDAVGISLADVRRQPLLTLLRVIALGGAARARHRATLLRPRLRHLSYRGAIRHPTRISLDVLASIGGGEGKPGFIGAMEAMLDLDFRERLGEIACPTLILHGQEDVLVPVADSWEFERLIPRARAVVLEDTGHVPMLERPRAFNRELLAFLAEDRVPTRSL